MSSKLELMIWLRVLVTLAYMKGWTDVRTDVHDVMAIKPNFLTSMGYQYFLNYGTLYGGGGGEVECRCVTQCPLNCSSSKHEKLHLP